nr:MAG: nucleotide-diphospho-sugar transferase [Lokiarchaeota virus Ratatoskr Meg22_1012]
MKIIGCMIAYNSEPYVKYAIEGILPYVDHLIIVYGAQKEFSNQVPDNTLNICIEYSQERSDKVFLLTGNFDNEAEQRNTYLEFIRKELDCTWMWIIDTDEFYKSRDVSQIKYCAGLFNKHDVLLYRFVNFYGRIPEGFNWYKVNETGMLKFIRWRDDLKYHYRQPQTLDNIGDTRHTTLWQNRRKIARVNGACCYHYGHVATEENYIRKLMGSCTRDSSNPKKKAFHDGDDDFRREWIKSNYLWFRKNWAQLLLLNRFRSDHPPQIERLINDNNYIIKQKGVGSND